LRLRRERRLLCDCDVESGFCELLALGTNLAVPRVSLQHLDNPLCDVFGGARSGGDAGAVVHVRRPASYGYYSYPQYYATRIPITATRTNRTTNYSYQPQYNGYYTYPYSSYYYPNGTYYQAARPYYYRY